MVAEAKSPCQPRQPALSLAGEGSAPLGLGLSLTHKSLHGPFVEDSVNHYTIVRLAYSSVITRSASDVDKMQQSFMFLLPKDHGLAACY